MLLPIRGAVVARSVTVPVPDLARAHDALVPGGEMHLIGEMLRPERDGPLAPALGGLAEALDRSTGVAHSESEAVEFLSDAGFVAVSVHAFVPGSLTRVTGRREAT